jgi:hypothetical protein
MAENIVRLPENCKAFMAGGKRFIVHETLTVEGYAKLEELRLEMETGNTAGDILKAIGKVAGHLQKNNVYHASVVTYNAANAAERIVEGRKAAWLLTLTLFVRPEGADLSAWSEAEAGAWIDEWTAEGIAVDDLFMLANACQTAFVAAFLRSSPITSGEPEGGEQSEA